MGKIAIARPGRDVCPPAITGYVAHVPDVMDAAGALVTQRDSMARELRALPDERGDFRYGPDKWSVKQVLGHMCDAERIFAYRLLRIARADETPLPGFDESTYMPVAGFEDRRLPDVIDEWLSVRGATQTLVEGLPPAAWVRVGTANLAPISAGAILYLILGHVEHHRGVLADRYGVGVRS